MITIHLSTEDLTKVRLAPSPLWETVTSFGVLLHHGRDSVHASSNANGTASKVRDPLALRTGDLPRTSLLSTSAYEDKKTKSRAQQSRPALHKTLRLNMRLTSFSRFLTVRAPPAT